MKKCNLRILLLLAGLAAGICCLGAAPQSDATFGEPQTTSTEHLADDERWDEETEEWEDHDEEGEEDFDHEDELEWNMAEQEMLARTVALAAEVANDEVKTAVVSATLLIEHAELTTAIDTLKKAAAETNSAAVKRALRLKLMEAHLENDDPTSAVSIATQLMVGE